ncbi:MAG: carbohydrate kinase family protein [Oscillospiraceae bacterium]|nr:carbohydrate kinase family protein [Oscillospiraceae bacterium]
MSGAAFDLTCVGTALVDSIVRGFDPVPVSASGYRAESGTLSVGGEAVNEAMAGAKLGLRTRILCFLGADAAGDMVQDALSRAGVDTGAVVRETAHATPVSTLLVAADGTRRSVTNVAHRYNFHPERHAAALGASRVVTLASLFRAPFDDPAVVHAVVTAAKAQGSLVFADTKLPNFRTLTLEDLRDSLPLLDGIFPNEDEARRYTGETEPEAMAECFLRHGVGSVVVKLGGAGCLYMDAHETIRLRAYGVTAVDATGAGDNFIAGFVSALLRGASRGEALRFANACGALCATAVGASAALRSRAQVLEFMETHRMQ